MFPLSKDYKQPIELFTGRPHARDWRRQILMRGANEALRLYEAQAKKAQEQAMRQAHRAPVPNDRPPAGRSDSNYGAPISHDQPDEGTNFSKKALDGLEKRIKDYEEGDIKKLLAKKAASEKNLLELASNLTPATNPQFERSLANSLKHAADVINSRMSAMGRFGSGANSKILAQSLGQMSHIARANQYNQHIKHMLAANRLLDRVYFNRLRNKKDYYRANIDALMKMFIGGQRLEQNRQAKIDAQYRRWRQEQEMAWRRLQHLLRSGRLAAIPQRNAFRPYENDNKDKPFWASLLPVLANSALRLTKSDRRLKENIIFYQLYKGFKLYIFNYIGEKQRYIGVMAQDLLKTHSSYVLRDKKTNYLCVDYSKLGFAMGKISPLGEALLLAEAKCDA